MRTQRRTVLSRDAEKSVCRVGNAIARTLVTALAPVPREEAHKVKSAWEQDVTGARKQYVDGRWLSYIFLVPSKCRRELEVGRHVALPRPFHPSSARTLNVLTNSWIF